MRNRILSLLLTFALTTSCCLGLAVASDNSSDQSDEFESAWESMKDAYSGAANSIDFASPFLQYETFRENAIDQFSSFQYDLPDLQTMTQNSVFDLNVTFEGLKNTMKDLGHGTNYEIVLPEITVGYTQNIEDIFAESFGDIKSSIDLKDMNIPEDFRPSTLLENSIEERDKAISEIKKTEAFQTAKKQISYGDVYNLAQEGMLSPSLSDTEGFVLGSQKTASEILGMSFESYDEKTAVLYNIAIGNQDELSKHIAAMTEDYLENTVGLTQEKLDSIQNTLDRLEGNRPGFGLSNSIITSGSHDLDLKLPDSVQAAGQFAYDVIEDDLEEEWKDTPIESLTSEYGGGVHRPATVRKRK